MRDQHVADGRHRCRRWPRTQAAVPCRAGSHPGRASSRPRRSTRASAAPDVTEHEEGDGHRQRRQEDEEEHLRGTSHVVSGQANAARGRRRRPRDSSHRLDDRRLHERDHERVDRGRDDRAAVVRVRCIAHGFEDGEPPGPGRSAVPSTITASTIPPGRGCSRGRRLLSRTSARPALAALIEPVNVSTMMSPNRTSDTARRARARDAGAHPRWPPPWKTRRRAAPPFRRRRRTQPSRARD